MNRILLLTYAFCVLSINVSSQTNKEDSIALVVFVEQASIEKCAHLQRTWSKLPGVDFSIFCVNESAYFIRAPRKKYISESELFSKMEIMTPEIKIFRKFGSEADLLNRCEHYSSEDETKLVKLINGN